MNHEEVFGHLKNEMLTLSEAAEYLEMGEWSLYDIWVNEDIDGQIMFTTEELKRYKKEHKK